MFFGFVYISSHILYRGVTTTFWGQNNTKNEFSIIKLLRVQIFSQMGQLLKNHYYSPLFLNILGVKKTPLGATKIFGTQQWCQITQRNYL